MTNSSPATFKDVHVQIWCPEIDALVNQALKETRVEMVKTGSKTEVVVDGEVFLTIDPENRTLTYKDTNDSSQWHVAVLQRKMGAAFRRKAEEAIKKSLPYAELTGFYFNTIIDGAPLAEQAGDCFEEINKAIDIEAWKMTKRIFGDSPNVAQLSWVWARLDQITEIKKKAAVLLPFLANYARRGHTYNQDQPVEENLFGDLKTYLCDPSRMDLSKAEWRFLVSLKSKDGNYLQNKGLKEAGERLKRMCRVGSFAKGSLVTTIVEAFDNKYDRLMTDWKMWDQYLKLKEEHGHDPQRLRSELRKLNIAHYFNHEEGYMPKGLDPRHKWVESNMDAVVRAAVEESQAHPDILVFNGQVKLVADWFWNEGISRAFDKNQMRSSRTIQRAVREAVHVTDEKGELRYTPDGEPVIRAKAVVELDATGNPRLDAKGNPIPVMKTVAETMWPYWVSHSDRWHEEQIAKEAPTDGLKWESLVDTYFTARGLDKFKDPVTGKVPIDVQYKVKPLTDSYQLFLEGRSMKHCVGGGSYTDSCVRGHYRIFTIRRGELKIATCQLYKSGNQWTVGQIAGVGNAGVSPNVAEIGRDLARRYTEAERKREQAALGPRAAIA